MHHAECVSALAKLVGSNVDQTYPINVQLYTGFHGYVGSSSIQSPLLAHLSLNARTRSLCSFGNQITGNFGWHVTSVLVSTCFFLGQSKVSRTFAWSKAVGLMGRCSTWTLLPTQTRLNQGDRPLGIITYLNHLVLKRRLVRVAGSLGA
jgi:hypothetical protein